MGLFHREKRNKQIENSKEINFQVNNYGGLVPTFYAERGNFEQSEAASTCIQTNAQYCSKVEFSSLRICKDGERNADYPGLDKLLQYSPNPFMPAAVFWERVAYFYFNYNNTFIYVERDNFYNIIALWSIDPSSMRFSKLSSGEIVVKFSLNGREREELYCNMIHVARFVTSNIMFGKASMNNAIKRVLELINLNYKGIENAILTSAAIRYIISSTSNMNEKDLNKKAKKFTDSFLNVKKNDGVGVVYKDNKIEVTPVDNKTQKTANYAETNQWNQSVYKFFGCPEKIIQGIATEEEMTSYFDRTLEPFFLRLAQEMTRKLFSDTEFGHGNRIVYNERKILYMSMKTRLELFTKVREIGCFTLGTLGDLIGLPVPNDKRDVVVTSQNYNDSLKDQNNKDNKDTKDGEETKEDETNAE